MSNAEVSGKSPQHVVCTHDQARKYIEEQKEYYIGTCGCRKDRGGCTRSRMDVCLTFNNVFSPESRPATKKEALELVDLADEKGLVTRPFRKPEDKNQLDGICFCCPECCYYFNHTDIPCDKGSLRESTVMEDCSGCGLCVESCHFGARSIVDGRLVVDADKCYGCGLCVDACPAGYISMK